MRICERPDCKNRHYGKGLCRLHWNRVRRNGDPDVIFHVYDGNREKHPLRSTYFNMIDRCYNPKNIGYAKYGGRGIRVCDRWRGLYGFDHFIEDMGEKPTNDHTIDRIDPNGNYEPSNCRWATVHEQQLTKRTSSKNVGVSKTAHNTWNARLTVGKITYRKKFKSKDEAIRYRKELELKHLGVIL
jgi:hypothetical protein